MKEITHAEFQQEIQQHELVVLDFYSTECPPCEALAPKFEYLATLYGEKVRFLKIFRQNNRELAKELGVSSSPSLVFFNKGKKLDVLLSGGIKTEDIMLVLDSMLSPSEVKQIKEKIKPVYASYDAVILGAGPAGLTAGIYLAQAKVNTLIIDKRLPGGQVSTTHQVSNYPGFAEPQHGYMLGHYMWEQAKNAGANFKVAVDITKTDLINKEIIVDNHEYIKAKQILIATGASPRLLNIPGEDTYKGRGISYCATCDAKYYEGKEVIIIGGGNTAIEESELISKFASKITIIHQFDELQANKQAQEKAFANEKIKFLFSHEPRKFEKVDEKMVVTAENLKTKELIKLETDGIFVFVGMKPNLEGINPLPALDEWGYIKIDADTKTNIPDVYAAGDVASKKYRQITIAVAEGTIASLEMAKKLG